MVRDPVTGLMVDPAWADIQHPVEKPLRASDATALRNPAPNVETEGRVNNYLLLTGANGGGASTPDSDALHIVGDNTFIVCVACDDWTIATDQYIIGKMTSPQRAYAMGVNNTDGQLFSKWSTTGSDTVTDLSTVYPVCPDDTRIWLKTTLDVDDGSGNHVSRFYRAGFSYTVDPSDIIWTLVGAAVTTAGTTSIYAGTTALEVGARGTGLQSFAGKIYRAQVLNSSGTVVADFNPNDAAAGATTMVSSTTGETWTINGSSSLVAGTMVAGLEFAAGTYFGGG